MPELLTASFATTGMHCPSCSMLVKLDVGDLDGVESVDSDHRIGMTTVTYDPDRVSPQQIAEAIATAGYEASLIDS